MCVREAGEGEREGGGERQWVFSIYALYLERLAQENPPASASYVALRLLTKLGRHFAQSYLVLAPDYTSSAIGDPAVIV